MTSQDHGKNAGLGARRFPRVTTYKHARIETEGDNAVSVSGVVFEVGAQGCGIRSEGEIEPGALVKVCLYDQSRLDPVVFRAKVVWRGNIEGTHMKSYGIQFLKCDAGRESVGSREMESILSNVGSKLEVED